MTITNSCQPGVLGAAEKPRTGDRLVFGMARGIGIDNEGAVHAFLDVPLQRQGVAVIEMAAERLGVELIDKFLARADQTGAWNTVHARGMNAVEMHGMRM